jgi:hypothetical protein
VSSAARSLRPRRRPTIRCWRHQSVRTCTAARRTMAMPAASGIWRRPHEGLSFDKGGYLSRGCWHANGRSLQQRGSKPSARSRQPARELGGARARRGARGQGSDRPRGSVDYWCTEPWRNPTKRGACGRIAEAWNLAHCRDKARKPRGFGLLAMQKVEGSSPFSRFEEVPRSREVSAPSSPLQVSGWQALLSAGGDWWTNPRPEAARRPRRASDDRLMSMTCW